LSSSEFTTEPLSHQILSPFVLGYDSRLKLLISVHDFKGVRLQILANFHENFENVFECVIL
jgi:hypothetical protein